MVGTTPKPIHAQTKLNNWSVWQKRREKVSLTKCQDHCVWIQYIHREYRAGNQTAGSSLAPRQISWPRQEPIHRLPGLGPVVVTGLSPERFWLTQTYASWPYQGPRHVPKRTDPRSCSDRYQYASRDELNLGNVSLTTLDWSTASTTSVWSVSTGIKLVELRITHHLEWRGIHWQRPRRTTGPLVLQRTKARQSSRSQDPYSRFHGVLYL